MTADELLQSAHGGSEPPEGVSQELAALWQAEAGAWDAAHQIVQDLESANAAWVHAHLHREEGDLGNAGYWYRRAGKPTSVASLSEERRQIADALLALRG